MTYTLHLKAHKAYLVQYKVVMAFKQQNYVFEGAHVYACVCVFERERKRESIHLKHHGKLELLSLISLDHHCHLARA